MILPKAIVVADEYVWTDVQVVWSAPELQVFTRNDGGGLDLDMTFTGVDGYNLMGQSYLFSSKEGIVDHDGDPISSLKVLVNKRCGCK